MSRIAIIGGTGFSSFEGIEWKSRVDTSTPYGTTSSPVMSGALRGINVLFLARHGEHHTIAPHRINYRANLWALKEQGARVVLALAAVGGIQDEYAPGVVVLPDQIIDYTYGREHCFAETGDEVVHVEFTRPYCEELRSVLNGVAEAVGVPLINGGVYAATQGPRLESAAEVNRMEGDGANIIGMTGMPEAALARELGLCYASLAIVVNFAAGRGGETITGEDMQSAFATGADNAYRILNSAVPRLVDLGFSLPVPLRL
jgi:5'-deoxy-5'-methylthioadenosine phosphorylase